MKIGIMSFAHHHAEAYIHNLRAVNDVELIGIADEDLERGRHFANLHDVRLFPSYEALLLTKPDGVLICSENAKHRALVEMAAEAGVNILCEKPLATNLADAQVIVDVCQEAGIMLMTAFPMRFSPPLVEVKAQLDANAIGKVYCCTTTNQGRMPIEERAWFVDKELAGGGAVMDHTVHLVDILRWYLQSEVVEVYAQTNHILHADKVDVETAGLIMLTFADGTFASIDCSWSKPLNYPTWGGMTMELISERGLTVVNAFSQNLDVFGQYPAGNNWIYWGSDANQIMVEEFINAIRDGREPAITGEDGYRALEIALTAYRSAEIERPVAI
jgi:predicted dehydrogenase